MIRTHADVTPAVLEVMERTRSPKQDDSREDFNLRGKFTTNRGGRLWFRSVRPAGAGGARS